MSKREYDDLAAAIEDGTFTFDGGTVLRGDEAKAQARADLLHATGTDTLDAAVRVAIGRPRIDETNDNVTWRVRATKQLDATVRELSEREGKNRSAIIREAVAEYARAHG